MQKLLKPIGKGSCIICMRKEVDREFMPEDESMALRDRIINEIQGMDKLPDHDFGCHGDYKSEVQVRNSPW